MQGKDVCLRICVDVRGKQRSNLSEICYFFAILAGLFQWSGLVLSHKVQKYEEDAIMDQHGY